MKRSLLPLMLFFLSTTAAVGDDWPQWLGPQRDGIWRETGIVTKFPSGGPKTLWRAPVAAGYTGPAVAGGRVFLLDRLLDEGVKPSKNQFNPSALKGQERVLAFDAKTGKQLWVHSYPCTYEMIYPLGPRCTPSVDGNRVYSLGAMGNLICLEADTGKVVWEVDLPKQYRCKPPGAGYSAHPLIDGDRLICMVGQGAAVVAFNKNTGKELWRALSAPEAGYAPPVIAEIGGKRQLISWDPAQLAGLDPETGKVLWTEKLASQMNMNVVMPRIAGNEIFLSLFFQGSSLFRIAADGTKVETVYKNKADKTSGIKCMNGTPFLKDGHVYGVCGNGELRCLKLENNARVWETLLPVLGKGRPTRHATAFLIPNGELTYIFNEAGEIVIAKLTPKGYEELDRAKVIEPTFAAGGRDVVWCHPAFANRCLYVRNDKELICVSLAAE